MILFCGNLLEANIAQNTIIEKADKSLNQNWDFESEVTDETMLHPQICFS